MGKKKEHKQVIESRQVEANELRESLNQSGYHGENYSVSKELKLHGPMKNRRCTDCLFTIIFIAFGGLMCWVAAVGYKNGDP